MCGCSNLFDVEAADSGEQHWLSLPSSALRLPLGGGKRLIATVSSNVCKVCWCMFVGGFGAA